MSTSSAAGVERPTFAAHEASTRQRRIDALSALAHERDYWREKNAAYYRDIERLIRFVVPAGADVLEIGCGTGDLLAALCPARGLGIDIAPPLVERARA